MDNGSQSSPTLASVFYEQLLAGLLRGEFRPGERLSIQSLTKAYDASISPVREALNRLSAQGYLAQSDQRGFFVPKVSFRELTALTRTRCLIIDIALRESIERGDAAWAENVVLANYRLSQLTDRYDPEYSVVHRAFHRSLISACESPWLMEFSDRLLMLGERYQALAKESSTVKDIATRAADHDALARAVLDRNADEAVRLHQNHIQEAYDAICDCKDLFDEETFRLQRDYPSAKLSHFGT